MSEHDLWNSMERIVILESEVKALKQEQDKILLCVQDIHAELIRYKGFLGGVAFIASGVGVFITLFKDWIIKHL